MMKLRLTLVLLITVATCLAQAKPDARRGVVQGRVTQRLQGSPIVGAIVQVVGDTLKGVTDQQGRYVIRGVRPGYNTLYVRADYYHSHVPQSFMLTASAPSVVDVQLDESSQAVDEVIVTASPLQLTTESPVSMRRLGVEEIDMTPGANRDISKVVQATPGVVTIKSGNRNDILVRGGGANENRYFLDGIEIPVLNHFAVQGGSGGHASLVNTDQLRSANFYTSAFPAQFGSGLSSVLDMQMDKGNSDSFHGKFILGASDVGLNVDTPISKNGKTTLIASYRRSYLQMLFSVLELPFLPTYNDYQFKISSELSPKDELYFIGLGSFDNNVLNTSIKDPEPSRQYILGYLPGNDQTSYVFGAGWRHSFEGGQTRVVASRNYLYNRLYKHQSNNNSEPLLFDMKSHEADYRVRANVELWDVGGFKLTAGAGGGYGSFSDRQMHRRVENGASSTSQTDKSFGVWRYEAYATLSRYLFNEKLSLLGGLRMDGMTYSDHTNNPLDQLSPRLSIGWKPSPKWRVSGSIARYYQEPSYITMGYEDAQTRADNRDGLRYMAVNHYVAGVEWSPNAQSSLLVEGFYKKYSRLPVSLIDSLPVSTGDFSDFQVGSVPVRSVGRGRSYGAEVSYRNLDFYNTIINLTYTLLYSEVNRMDDQLRATGDYFSSSWDVRHIANISAIHKFGRNWTVGGKWSLTGGYPFTPYDIELSSQIDAWDNRRRPYYDYSLYNNDRAGMYHQLDVRVDKVWFFRKWRLGFYVDIQNIYNSKSAGQDILMPHTDASGAYVPDPLRPNHYQMNRIPNDVGGTILPTLGITIEL